MRGYRIRISKTTWQEEFDIAMARVRFGLEKMGVNWDDVQIYGFTDGCHDVLDIISFK